MNNLNEIDFAFAEAWLSERNFYSQRDFNSDFKDRPVNNDLTTTEILPNFANPDVMADFLMGTQAFGTTAPREETFGSAFSENLPTDSYDRKSELLDLSISSVAPNPEPFKDVGYVAENFPSVVMCEGQQDVLYPFDSADELQLLSFLEGRGNSPSKNLENNYQLNNQNSHEAAGMYEMPVDTSTTSNTQEVLKCEHCNIMYDVISFQGHVCAGAKVKPEDLRPPLEELAPAPEIQPVPKKIEPFLTINSACIRLLKENQIRIRRFLKDIPKCVLNNLAVKGNSVIDPIDSTTSSSSEILNSSSSLSVTLQSTGTKKQEGPHECTLCERKFVHASGLLRHMEKHALDLIPTTNSTTDNGLRVVVKCTLCGRLFFEPHSSFIHFCSHFPNSDIDEIEMDNCADAPYERYLEDASLLVQQETKTSSIAMSHLHERKAPEYFKIVILSCILQCEFCDFVFSDVSYLFVHSSCHLPERRFECMSCGIYVKSSKQICSHWQAECVFMRENQKIHHAITQRYFVCNVCENKFPTLDLLHEHRYSSYHFFPRFNKRFGTVQLPCEYCEFMSDNAHECLTHYEEKHYRRYKRGEKEAAVSGSRKARPYLCDICGKSYTQSCHLGQHLRFHQGVKPFACKEPGCTRKFTIRPDLNDHIRKCHTGERPYQCLICGKRFLTGSVFYQHRLIHRGERRYECEECGKRFYRTDALKNHQRIHTGEKPFGCPFCTKKFRQSGDCGKHIRARHSHLDANARTIMQRQKLQLEAAAAAQQFFPQQPLSGNKTTPIDFPFDQYSAFPSASYNFENTDPSSSAYGGDSSVFGGNYMNLSNNNDVITIGNISFPRSMFDTNDEALFKALM